MYAHLNVLSDIYERNLVEALHEMMIFTARLNVEECCQRLTSTAANGITCVNVVASLTENGTSSTFASVLANRVFPEPVGPLWPHVSPGRTESLERGYSHDQNITLFKDRLGKREGLRGE